MEKKTGNWEPSCRKTTGPGKGDVGVMGSGFKD